MGVHKFEHLHGVVLTKLMRSDRPTTLRMVETAPKEAWSLYRVNDAVDLLIKCSTAPRELSRERAQGGHGYAWTFTFTPAEVRKALERRAGKQSHLSLPPSTYAALVCAFPMHSQQTKLCLLEPAELGKLLTMAAPMHVPGAEVAIPAVEPNQQSITVKSVERKFLRVTSRHEVALLVPQSRLETWTVPGN